MTMTSIPIAIGFLPLLLIMVKSIFTAIRYKDRDKPNRPMVCHNSLLISGNIISWPAFSTSTLLINRLGERRMPAYTFHNTTYHHCQHLGGGITKVTTNWHLKHDMIKWEGEQSYMRTLNLLRHKFWIKPRSEYFIGVTWYKHVIMTPLIYRDISIKPLSEYFIGVT